MPRKEVRATLLVQLPLDSPLLSQKEVKGHMHVKQISVFLPKLLRASKNKQKQVTGSVIFGICLAHQMQVTALIKFEVSPGLNRKF